MRHLEKNSGPLVPPRLSANQLIREELLSEMSDKWKDPRGYGPRIFDLLPYQYGSLKETFGDKAAKVVKGLIDEMLISIQKGDTSFGTSALFIRESLSDKPIEMSNETRARWEEIKKDPSRFNIRQFCDRLKDKLRLNVTSAVEAPHLTMQRLKIK